MSAKKANTNETKVNELLSAIKAIKIGKQSINSVAESYKIPKTNLLRYIGRLDKEVADIAVVSDSSLLSILHSCTARLPPTMVCQGFFQFVCNGF